MEEKKLRFWENWVVLLGILLFLRQYLIKVTHYFDDCIDRLIRNGLPSSLINAYRDEYSHIGNSILPMVLLAAAVYLAWYTFHHYAFPLLREKPHRVAGLPFLLLTLALLLIGSYMYQQLRMYWELVSYHGGYEDSFRFYRHTRKITLVATSLTFLWAIFLYEACSRGFYALCRRLKREGPMYDLVINFLFAFCAIVFLVFLGLAGGLSEEKYLGISSVKIYHMILVLPVAIIFGQDYFAGALWARQGARRYLSAVFVVIAICFFSALAMEIMTVGYYTRYGIRTQGADFHYTGQALNHLFKRNIPESSAIALLTALVALSVGWVRYLFYWQKNRFQTQVSVKSAELDQLRAQVNPHFLFNALNTLYSVALKEKAETTASGIQKLGDMMRFMLNENHRDLIPISREIEQMENYIDIQRMRIDETQDIRITVHLQEPEGAIEVAPMLLNPFVENAFKHGISLVNPSWIHITLTFDKENLYFKVHNSLHSSRETDPEKFNHGIGLDNVRRRLN
ncbi:MAG: histidine kinase, partial [Leadbetterella sp.]|nr:histidine kinase [Leadbetterella sp.]